MMARSRPSWARELKHRRIPPLCAKPLSRPSWARELKPSPSGRTCQSEKCRAPRGRVN